MDLTQYFPSHLSNFQTVWYHKSTVAGFAFIDKGKSSQTNLTIQLLLSSACTTEFNSEWYTVVCIVTECNFS